MLRRIRKPRDMKRVSHEFARTLEVRLVFSAERKLVPVDHDKVAFPRRYESATGRA